MSMQRSRHLPSGRCMLKKSWRQALALAALCLGSSATNAVEPLTTQGNQILVGGEARPLAGNSLFWHNVPAAGQYYDDFWVTRMKNDFNSKIVRAAIGIEVGFNADRTYLGDKSGSLAAIDRVVQSAVANDMYVIVDFHSHHANAHEATAHDFFSEVASRYNHLDNIIYEVFNEPEWCDEGHRWGSTIKPYAESVIGTIRQHDPDNLVVVGTRCFSQFVQEAAANPINDHNVAYALHFYAFSHRGELRNLAQQALDMGAPLFVTEWGTTHFSGDNNFDPAESRVWVDWLNARNIPHVNWSFSHQPELSAVFNGDGSLTPSGQLIQELVSETNGGGENNIIDGPCNLGFVPSRVEAEDFCQASGIQFEDTTDAGGGQNLGWVDDGDWVTFDVDVPETGEYSVEYRVASEPGGGVIRLEQAGGGQSFGTVAVPSTGDWQSWVTISQTVNLSQGTQTLALVAVSGDWNLNWFELSSNGPCVGNDCPCETDCPSQSLFQAENFSAMQGIQTQETSDSGGGLNVGWVDAGDWMRYSGSIEPSASGLYEVSYRVARQPAGNSSLRLENGSGQNLGELSIPSTSGWQQWQTIKHTIAIPAGTSEFRVFATGSSWNLNWFEIKPATTGPNPDPITVQAESFSASSGVIVRGDSVGWIDPGDWMTYSNLDIPSSASGQYRITYRVARGTGGSARFKIEQPGGGVNYGEVSVPDTGGWNNYTTVSHVISLPAGTDALALAAIDGGWNIDWFTVEAL